MCFFPCVFSTPTLPSWLRTAKTLGQKSTCFVNHLMFFQPSLSSLSALAAPKDSNSQPGIILVSDCQTRKLAFKLRKNAKPLPGLFLFLLFPLLPSPRCQCQSCRQVRNDFGAHRLPRAIVTFDFYPTSPIHVDVCPPVRSGK